MSDDYALMMNLTSEDVVHTESVGASHLTGVTLSVTVDSSLLERVSASHSVVAVVYNSLGWAYLQSGDYEHAVQEFQLAKDPAVYSTLSPASRQKVDNNLSLAESYLRAKASAKP